MTETLVGFLTCLSQKVCFWRDARRLTILHVAILALSGCVTSTVVPFEVESAPQGAQINVNQVRFGVTPIEIRLQCTKRWVGLAVAPGGWAYDEVFYEVSAHQFLRNPSVSQTKLVNPCQIRRPPGHLYFHLENEVNTPQQEVGIETDQAVPPKPDKSVAYTGASHQDKVEEVPLVKMGGVYEVPIEINDVLMLNFVIDSGASEVNVPADVVLTLLRTGTIKNTDFLPGKTYVLADGSELRSPRFLISSLKIGSHKISHVSASIGNATGSLLLGQSFLERLGAWGIDSQRGILIISPSIDQN